MEAVIRETMRVLSPFPLSIMHRAVKDTTLGEYSIPADTMITNLGAMHHDPDLWGDPENFRPERFINENGELVKDMTFPFSFGMSIYRNRDGLQRTPSIARWLGHLQDLCFLIMCFVCRSLGLHGRNI